MMIDRVGTAGAELLSAENDKRSARSNHSSRIPSSIRTLPPRRIRSNSMKGYQFASLDLIYLKSLK
jgi:hypothetical protein